MNVEDAEKGSTRVVQFRIQELFVLEQEKHLLCLYQSVSCSFLEAKRNSQYKSAFGYK